MRLAEYAPRDPSASVLYAVDVDVLACPRCGGRLRLIAVLEAKPGYDDGQAKAVCIALFRHLGPRHALTEKFSRAFNRAVNV